MRWGGNVKSQTSAVESVCMLALQSNMFGPPGLLDAREGLVPLDAREGLVPVAGTV